MRVLLAPVLITVFAAHTGASAPRSFSFVFIPDPHLGHGENGSAAGSVWDGQTTWVQKNASKYNVRGVFCSGDYPYGDNFETALASAWTYGFAKFEGVMPWLSSPGNHDYDFDTPYRRSTVAFDAQIGSGRAHSGFPYAYNAAAGYGANQWIKFSVAGRRFLVMALEFFPRAGALIWADGVLSEPDNVDREVIIVTHSYVKPGATYKTATLVGRDDAYGPNA